MCRAQNVAHHLLKCPSSSARCSTMYGRADSRKSKGPTRAPPFDQVDLLFSRVTIPVFCPGNKCAATLRACGKRKALSPMIKIPKLRWVIAGLLLLATVLNYTDRLTLSVIIPHIRHSLSISEEDYAQIIS